LFGLGYAAARTFSEFFRDPDPRLEDLGNGLTMGMLLSAPMALIGIALLVASFVRARPTA
jgi:phosphatidylglycerol:prolipoprotein diacylglycerol transferase